MPLTCADISKARKLLGYKPTTRLSEGLPRFMIGFCSAQMKTLIQRLPFEQPPVLSLVREIWHHAVGGVTR